MSALTDVIAVALSLIASRGREAAPAAATRSRDHRQAGEMEGAVFWRQVAAAVRALENEARLRSESAVRASSLELRPPGSPLP